jgi:2-dehydro-3-deoxyphosphogluconate aldolase/(4S)-4-hydroxy-2-oxoglutarate aldolase
MHETLARIEREKIVGIIRTDSADEAYKAALAAIKGGLKMIEITLTVPEGFTVIGELARNPEILVAAGTVLNPDMAELAINAGAKWLISPHTDKEIIQYCVSQHICVSAGAMSPNEIFNAWNLGPDIVKVYPIHSVGGARYIQSVLEPMPFLKLMPTGSIHADNVVEYLEAGAIAVGVGNSIFDKTAIRYGDYDKITEKTHKMLTMLKGWYEAK